MAILYEVLQGLPTVVAQAAAVEEVSFKEIDDDVTLTTDDPRIGHIDPSDDPLTVTLPEFPYKGYTFTGQNVTANTNSITLDGNGKNINGNPDITFSGAYAGRTVQYDEVLDAYIVIRSVG